LKDRTTRLFPGAMLRIVTIRWGNAYSQNDVTRLQNSIICSVPYTFHCVESDYEDFTPYHEKHYRGKGAPSSPREIIHNGYHRDDLGGIPHHRKLCLFNLDKNFNEDDKILYLDLDTVIEGDLAYFDDLSLSQPYIVKNYWWEDGTDWKRLYSRTRCPLFNSSVLLWKRGQNRPIYNTARTQADKIFYTYPSVDTFLFHNFRNWFAHFDRGIIQSRRVNESKSNNRIIEMLEGLPSDEKRSTL